jgi:manganese/zinc/iron transport system permease protein
VAAGFGAVAGVTGAVLSAEVARLPTGPTIVLCATAIVLLSILVAPRRGLIWREVRGRRDRRQLRLTAVLEGLHALEQQHPGADHGHPAATISVMSGGALKSLEELERRGLVRQLREDEWVLTEAGRTRIGR